MFWWVVRIVWDDKIGGSGFSVNFEVNIIFFINGDI